MAQRRPILVIRLGFFVTPPVNPLTPDESPPSENKPLDRQTGLTNRPGCEEARQQVIR